jgi:hydrogenase expression/formation protein HypC
MCLGELAEVIEVRAADTVAVATEAGRRSIVSTLVLEEPVRTGDWLLVHAGFALGRLTAAEALEARRIRAMTTTEEATG